MRFTGGGQGGGVQSLGREELNNGVNESKAGLALTIAGEVDVYQERKTKHEVSMLNASLVTFDSDLKKKYEGQERIKVDSLPKTMQKKHASKDEVPKHEVYAELYDQEIHRFMEENSASIGDSNVRDAWLVDKKATASTHIAQLYVDRDNQAREYFNKESLAAASEAVDDGNYPVALALIADADIDKVDKDALSLGVNKRQETDIIDDMIIAKDSEGLKKMSAMLSSSKYDGPFKNEAERLTLRDKITSARNTIRAEFEKHEVYGKAQKHTHEIVNTDLNRTDQLAKARGIKDDAVAQETVKQVKQRHAEQDAAEAKQLKDKKEEWWDGMKSDPSAERFSTAPDAATESEGRRWLAQRTKEGALTTDLATYHKVNTMIQSGKHVELMDYQARLSESDFKKFSDRINNPESALNRSALSVDREIKNRLFDMGLAAEDYGKSSNKGKAARAMYEVFDTELWMATEQKGSALTVKERTELFDQIALTKIKEPDEDWYLFTDTGEDITLADIPDGEIDEIIQALRQGGRDISAHNVIRTYVETQ